MALTSVAVVIPHRPAMFELGVVQEVFGVDRTDDGVPRIDFRVCAERPGEPIDLENGMSMTAPYGLDAAEGADLVDRPCLRQRRAALGGGARPLSQGARARSLAALGLHGRLPVRRGGSAGRTLLHHPLDAHRGAEAALPRRDGRPRRPVRRGRPGGHAAPALRPGSTPACTTSGASSVRQSRTRSPGGWWCPRSGTAASASTSTCRSRAATRTASLPLLTWMREHLAEEQPVKVLARRASMSERTFARRFAAETGTTPGKWLLAQRLHHARTLLESSDVADRERRSPIGVRICRAAATPLRHPRRSGAGGVPPYVPHPGRARRLTTRRWLSSRCPRERGRLRRVGQTRTGEGLTNPSRNHALPSAP